MKIRFTDTGETVEVTKPEQKSFKGTPHSLYSKFHKIINKENKKAGVCSFCKQTGKKKYEWALIKGREYSQDINDYIELCVKCHRNYDVTEETREKCKARMKAMPKETLINRLPSLKGCTGELNPKSKPVLKIDKNTGDILKEYVSIRSAMVDGYQWSNICHCLKGKHMTAYGFKWEYKNNIKQTLS
jgi:hypothetical protein